MTFRNNNQCPIPGCPNQRYMMPCGKPKSYCYTHWMERQNEQRRRKRLEEGLKRHPNARLVRIVVNDYGSDSLVAYEGYEVGREPMPISERDLKRRLNQVTATGGIVVEQVDGHRIISKQEAG